jgi:hypothetical protein
MRSEKFQTGSKDSSSATAALIETIAMRFICLPNVKGVARRRMDVQSEANEGRYPPLPLPSCSVFFGGV